VRRLRIAGRAAAVLAAAASAWAIWVSASGIPRYQPAPPELHVDVTPDRVARGKKLASLLCAECHADDATGKLTGKHLAEMPKQFGDIWSKNITQDPEAGIGLWSDGDVAYFLRTGVRPDGQYVPPWMPRMTQMSDEDLASVIAYLRSSEVPVSPSKVKPAGVTKPSFLSKALSHTSIGRPMKYPAAPIVAPPKSDRVAFGRYLVTALDCYGCHSADFLSNDGITPEKSKGFMGGGNTVTGADGVEIHTANLTADDATGIGKWSEEDFVRAVRVGFRPDGRVLRYPMLPKPELEEDEARAIYAYLRTVPKLSHDVDRNAPGLSAGAVAHPGKKLFVSYGCVGCHGESGVGMSGLADLRRANEHYPSDVELRSWIEDAGTKKPGTKMPSWRGIVKDEDFPPLLAYVRSLSAAPDGRQAAR
jgi:mono/diheme cytochrome c family protein